MIQQEHDYVIVGAGLAAGAAIAGIRDKDDEGTILLIGNEEYLPYNRPPLTKKLWFGKETEEEIFVNDKNYYIDSFVDVLLDTTVVALDANKKMITDSRRNQFPYGTLLLATGGEPRKLDIPGADLPGICYYRYLRDYHKIHETAGPNKTAVIIGGGFIGTELAAALCVNGVQVIMIFPEDYIVNRVFPEALALAQETKYLEKGILIFKGDVPVSFEMLEDGRYLTRTRNGKAFESDMIIVGAGIKPHTELAEMAKLEVANGIKVNTNLQTSNRFIYAAGDNTQFPYTALGEDKRVEHWDNALNQGRHAGWNMTGKGINYDYMPYFFSDMFDFGYEAVGDTNPSYEIFTDWQKENDTGVIYYIKDKRVRGVMACNIYGKLDDARKMIRSSKQIIPDELKGKIR
ncbi:MAG: NAD(P)/FAD-dependent oxidoreductase [Armatimonadota bacterium]